MKARPAPKLPPKLLQHTFDELLAELNRIAGSLQIDDGGRLHRKDDGAAEFFDLLYVVLQVLVNNRNVPVSLRRAVAGDLAPKLLQIREAFMSGQFKHLEDVFGWERQTNKHLDALAERERLSMPVYIAVGRLLEEGKPQADAFDQVAGTYSKSKTFIEKVFREMECKWHMMAAKKKLRPQVNSRK